jgi:hypothetical protein
MAAEPAPQQPALQGCAAGWVIAIVLALAVAFWMFSSVQAVVEHLASAPVAAAISHQ